MNPLENDLKLNEHLMKIRKAANKLAELMRDGKRLELWEALEACNSNALDALYRMNDLRFKRKEK